MDNVGFQKAEERVFFSIIMPTYNRAHLIGKAIDSVLKQTYAHFELIVVNDGGSDDTEEVVKAFNDPRINYYWKKNEQKGIAKNFGFEKAKGSYVTSFDDDDIMYPHHLETVLSRIDQNKYPPVLYVHYEIVDESGKFIRTAAKLYADINQQLLTENPLSNNGVFIERKITKEYRYHDDPNLTLSADWLLWLRMSRKYKFLGFPDITHGVLEHDKRGTAIVSLDKFIRNKDIFLKALQADPLFMKMSPGALKKIEAYYNTYIALFSSLQGKKIGTLKYLLKGLVLNPAEIKRKRVLAIFKYLLIKF